MSAGVFIMLMRHAEKPLPGADGVTEDGEYDQESLTVRGWQRAGALAAYLSQPKPPLRLPLAICAAGVVKRDGSGSRSKRPAQTVSPLAALLGLKLDQRFSKGEEAALARDLLTRSGPVLVCWQHNSISDIATALVGNDTTAPAGWPDDVFDWVWILSRDETGNWHFTDTHQQLLAGNEASLPLI